MTTFDLPALESVVQEKWARERTFERSLDPSRPHRTVLEGPPTMNGRPGVHHALARVHKDVAGRLWTMQGCFLPRRAGWDCHGLPVELSVASALGLHGPRDVEAHGLEAFTDACRTSVEHHQDLFTRFTKRLGYWVDTEDPYRTMDPGFTDAAWGALKELHATGSLVEDLRVSPWCRSCATSLSSHEEAQGAGEFTDTAVTVRLDLGDGSDLLVWTTTPWTLGENRAVGLDPAATYSRVRTTRGDVVVGPAMAEELTAAGAEVVSTCLGSDLLGRTYSPPLGAPAPGAHFVVAAEHANALARTGLVHLAPRHGSDDLKAARTACVLFDAALEPDGSVLRGALAGLEPEDVTPDLLTGLGVRLWETGDVTHAGASCWRCGTRLLDLARTGWFLRTELVKDSLLAFDDGVEWHPGGAPYRRWLEGVRDWSLTRERAWGTPLPVWRCRAGHVEVLGSRAELSARTGLDLSDLDLHRPHVDELTLTCACGSVMTRDPSVLDTWFDSALVPVVLDAPTADLVAEGSDQVRGWFFVMSALAAMLKRPAPFRRVLSLGLVLDENGAKMSKSRGNVVDPFEVMSSHGADALRLALLASSPGTTQRFSASGVSAMGALLAKAWACADLALGEAPSALLPDAHPQVSRGELPLLERWVLARSDEATRDVTEALEALEPHRALVALESLVEDLSTRFLRARRTSLGADARAAAHSVLERLALLLAPLAPHFADALGERVGVRDVHLSSWPVAADPDHEALAAGGRLWDLVDLGRAQRARAGLRQRQPLGAAELRVELDPGLRDVLAAELNVDEVRTVAPSSTLALKWPELGKRFGKRAQEVAQLLRAAEPAAEVTVTLDGELLVLSAGSVFELEPRDPLELRTSLTSALLRRGARADLLRDLVDARKRAGLLPGQPASVELSPERLDLLEPGDLTERSLELASAGDEAELVLR